MALKAIEAKSKNLLNLMSIFKQFFFYKFDVILVL